jgi:hypothetical protein
VVGWALFIDGGLSFPVPNLFGSHLLGLLAVVAAVVGSVALGRRGRGGRWRRVVVGAANLTLAIFGLVVVAELGSSEANDDFRPAELVTSYREPQPGLRADGREISNIFPFDAQGRPLRDVYLIDQDGLPVEASSDDSPYLEPTLPRDGDGNPVTNRYPQVQHQVDPATGQRSPGPTPEFRPPPGPVRSP